MEAVVPPLPADTWEALPSEVQMLILDLQAQVLALLTEDATLYTRIRELEGRLGQDSSNSSRPPSSDPPHALRQRPVPPTGRTRGRPLPAFLVAAGETALQGAVAPSLLPTRQGG